MSVEFLRNSRSHKQDAANKIKSHPNTEEECGINLESSTNQVYLAMCPFLMSAALDLSAMTSGLTPGTEEALFVLFLLPPAAPGVPPPDFTKKLSTLARGSRPAVTEAVDSLPRTPALVSAIEDSN